MAIVKISELPAADSPVSPSDVLPALQNGVTKKAAINQFGFLPAGANAVTRTIQNKLRETVSVKDFGAVGDGVTDDTAAIQAALNYLSNATNFSGVQGKLYFPAGGYLFSSTLVIPSNVKLYGNGKNFSTQLVPASSFTGTEALTIDGVGADGGYQFRISIEDLTINAVNFPSGRTLLFIRNAYTLRFHNVFFFNSASTLVKVTTSGSDQVNDVLFSFCSVYGSSLAVPFGFEIGGTSEINQLRIVDCDIENVSAGVKVTGNSKVSIVNPYMERIVQGVDCRQVDPGYVSIINPHIFAGPDIGVSIGFGLVQCDNTTIVGGNLEGASGGVYLGAAQVRPSNVQIIGTTLSSIVDSKNWITNKVITEPNWLQRSKVTNTKTVNNGVATDVYKINLQNISNELAIFDMGLYATLAGTSIWSARYKIAMVTDGVSGIFSTTVTEYAKSAVDGSAGNYTLAVAVTTNIVGYDLYVRVTQTLGGTLGSVLASSTTYTEGELICNNPLGYTYVETQ